jgi:hypothetical protein
MAPKRPVRVFRCGATGTAQSEVLDTFRAQAQFWLMKFKRDELRELIRQSHVQPLRVVMDDGKSYTIRHPDFALVSDVALLLVSGPGTDLDDAHFAICYFDHITRVETPKKKLKTTA